MTTFIKGRSHRADSQQLIGISEGETGIVSVSVISYGDHALIMLEPAAARATANALFEAARIAEEKENEKQEQQ
jgi:hypothetical protein